MKKLKIDYYQEIEDLLHKSSASICVAFAVYCAKSQLHNITDKSHYSKCSEILNITEKYMKGLTSKAELENAIKASSYVVSYAAYATAYAAYNAANASSASAYNAASYAANAASYAADAYNAATDYADKDIKFKEYYEVLLSMLDKLSKLEKLVYEI